MTDLLPKTKQRLLQDIRVIKAKPVDGLNLEFNPQNMLEWYCIIEGSEGTPFQGGFYLARIMLAKNYPFSPPHVQMITPSGRFTPGDDICFSYTNYHPESWSALLNPSHVALGLVSFMVDFKDNGIGCIKSTDNEMKTFAKNSIAFNLKNKIVLELFPEVVKKMKSAKIPDQK